LTCPLADAVAAASDPGLLGRFLRSVAATDDGWPDPPAAGGDPAPMPGDGAGVRVDAGPLTAPTTRVGFSHRGDAVSYDGGWTLVAGDGTVRASLTLDYEVAPPVVERAMNRLRARSPLPFRTDADAILRRALTDRFEEHLVRSLDAYADDVRQRAGVPA
jgi:hypothetical protein